MPVNRIISYFCQKPGMTITETTTTASPVKTTSILSFNQHTIYTLLIAENNLHCVRHHHRGILPRHTPGQWQLCQLSGWQGEGKRGWVANFRFFRQRYPNAMRKLQSYQIRIETMHSFKNE
jgi:hypothetical protein